MNNKMNKYLLHEVQTLLKHRPQSEKNLGNPELFWGTADRLMNS